MKKLSLIFLTTLCISSIFIGCSTNDGDLSKLSLKESLDVASGKLSATLGEIEGTTGYGLLFMENDIENSDARLPDIFDTPDTLDITLEDIKGIYEFVPDTAENWKKHHFFSSFEKTGDDNQFIIKMPKPLCIRPFHFFSGYDKDSVYANNFVVTTSEYDFSFSNWSSFDYNLNSSLEVDNSPAGNIMISSSKSSLSDYSYESSFDFGDDIKMNVTSSSGGDTSMYSIALIKDNDILFAETRNVFKVDSGDYHWDMEYILTLGNVKIKKTKSTHSLEVYLNDVLQENATIEIIKDSNQEENASIFGKRDIQITFDDGTTTTISELLGPSLEMMSQLYTSLKDIYFATNVVNVIAYQAYTESNNN